MTQLALQCHASSSSHAVRRITVTAVRATQTTLGLRFLVEGALAALRIPEPAPPKRTDELWRHTCFEAFVAGGEAAGYIEYNLSPSRAWAAYRFASYRDGMTEIAAQNTPSIQVQQDDAMLVLDARIDLAPESGLAGCAALRCGLAAVIEESSGNLSYWALAHPRPRPDFHAPEGFVLKLTVE